MPLHPVSRLSRLQLHNLARAVASSPLHQPAQPLAGVSISVDGDSPNARSMNANKESRDKTFPSSLGCTVPAVFLLPLSPLSAKSSKQASIDAGPEARHGLHLRLHRIHHHRLHLRWPLLFLTDATAPRRPGRHLILNPFASLQNGQVSDDVRRSLCVVVNSGSSAKPSVLSIAVLECLTWSIVRESGRMA